MLTRAPPGADAGAPHPPPRRSSSVTFGTSSERAARVTAIAFLGLNG
jgi:hypothetical protein